MISLHAEVPASVDVMISHDVIDRTEHILKEELHCEAVIHMDPVVTDDPRLDQLRESVKKIVEDWRKGFYSRFSSCFRTYAYESGL